jgi:hypothetical protein
MNALREEGFGATGRSPPLSVLGQRLRAPPQSHSMAVRSPSGGCMHRRGASRAAPPFRAAVRRLVRSSPPRIRTHRRRSTGEGRLGRRRKTARRGRARSGEGPRGRCRRHSPPSLSLSLSLSLAQLWADEERMA